jgi:uroporphyrinogen decarboxylase
MVEGGSSKGFDRVKRMMYDRPDLMRRLLDKIARALIDYLGAQAHAGAQALMIFDTWGGVLTPACFREFSLAYMERIVRALGEARQAEQVPIILYTKGGGQWLEAMSETGCDALGIDWTIDIGDARCRVGARVALQGNLDPCVLYASPQRIRDGVSEVLESYGRGAGHIFNLGHGIHPDVDPDRAAVMIEAVHELSRPYHP